MYPQQQLLPQEVKRGVNRSRIYLGVAAAMTVVVIAGALFWVLRDDGEDRREEYCAELRDLTNDGDLATALSSADPSTLERIQKLPDTAPNAVADDWQLIADTIATALEAQEPDMGQALTLFNAAQAISNDASRECGLDLQLI